MEPGTVKWFDEAKGYGFVTRANGEDVLVNSSAIQAAGFTNLKAGDAVQFDAVKGPHGWEANNILPIESPEDVVVTGQIMESGRGDKVLIFHFKRKKQYKRAYGHRQRFTNVRITEIAFDGERFTAPELKAGKLKKAQPEGASEGKYGSLKWAKSKPKSKSGFKTKKISSVLDDVLEKPWEKSLFGPTGTPNPGLTFGEDVMRASIMRKLGLRGALKSEADLVTLVEKRLPLTVISSLVQHGIIEKEVYSVIVPRRTLQHRRARKEKLSREESDRAVRLARLTTLAEKVFGDHESGMRWLRSPKKHFRGRTPMEMITTETGSRLAEETLHQIDEGMAA